MSKKEGKVAPYRTGCNEAWLVIVAYGMDIVSTASLDKSVYLHRFATSFDRVIWFNLFDQQAVTLNRAS